MVMVDVSCHVGCHHPLGKGLVKDNEMMIRQIEALLTHVFKDTILNMTPSHFQPITR